MTDNEFLKNYTEFGVKEGAKIREEDIEIPDLVKSFRVINTLPPNEVSKWLYDHVNEFDPHFLIVNTEDPEYMIGLKAKKPKVIINTKPLSHIRHLNLLIAAASDALPVGGLFCCHSRTSMMKHQVIVRKYHKFFGNIIYGFHYLWHRACSKLPGIRYIYFAITKGENRSFPRVEIMGRVCRGGFEIVDERFVQGDFYLMGRKIKSPRHYKARPYGMIIGLKRVGYKGKMIKVYKFRSMYAYSEYLQPYMMEHEGLARGGKYFHDYRINFWGRLFRSCMIDELPMFINLLKGDLKLVGVRPLSRAYFSLYTPEMQQLHISVKPGLLPPFYYEEKTPVTLDEIQESEKRYIEAYHEHPFRTDWRYFWGIIGNLVFKRKRSH